MAKIDISVCISASVERVWDAWNNEQTVTQWYFASDDWCCPAAQIDLAVGKSFCFRLEAKDGSMGFDFEGVFTEIIDQKKLVYRLQDERLVTIDFTADGPETLVSQCFDAENEFPEEQQRQGWQAILDQFKRFVESSH